MKRPSFVKKEDRALPSSYEAHFGETRDPTGHTEEIDGAKRVLRDFIEDMDGNRVPTATLDLLGTAVDTLCTYAGCPHGAMMFAEYLTSPYATSYRHTAALLKDYLVEISEVIDSRFAIAARRAASTQPNQNLIDDDLPF